MKVYLFITSLIGNILIFNALFNGTLKYNFICIFDALIGILLTITKGT